MGSRQLLETGGIGDDFGEHRLGLLLRLRARRLVARAPGKEDMRGAVKRRRSELEAVAAIVTGDLFVGRLRDADLGVDEVRDPLVLVGAGDPRAR